MTSSGSEKNISETILLFFLYQVKILIVRALNQLFSICSWKVMAKKLVINILRAGVQCVRT